MDRLRRGRPKGGDRHRFSPSHRCALCSGTRRARREHPRAFRRVASGIVAFSAVDRTFEFVAADHGIGVLNSLPSAPDYATLADHGTALQLALTDGVSRYGKEAKRGKGFRLLAIGLANLTGSLRFRTGDHALTIEDQTIDLMLSKTAQKVELKGFLISVACRL